MRFLFHEYAIEITPLKNGNYEGIGTTKLRGYEFPFHIYTIQIIHLKNRKYQGGRITKAKGYKFAFPYIICHTNHTFKKRELPR